MMRLGDFAMGLGVAAACASAGADSGSEGFEAIRSFKDASGVSTYGA